MNELEARHMGADPGSVRWRCQDGCVNSVTKTLKNVAGVQEANVDLEGAKATVTFDESKTNVASLKEAIEDAGYDVN